MSAHKKMLETRNIRDALDTLLRHLEHTANEMLTDDFYKRSVEYNECIPDNVITKFMDWWVEEVNRQDHKTLIDFCYELRPDDCKVIIKIHQLSPDPEWPDSTTLTEEVFADLLTEDESESDEEEEWCEEHEQRMYDKDGHKCGGCAERELEEKTNQ